jgi:DNA (cytosine-5)-methyltransferase 1
MSADIKDDAIKIYNLNFKENNNKKDIYSLKPIEIPKFDLLCAGFPCQPFSSAGNKNGFNDKRGGLIFKIVDICKHHKPKTIILENVYNLITLEKGKCIKKIDELFSELGYFVSYKKFNSMNFGLAQSRERVYIVCSLKKKVSFDNITCKKNKKLKQIIDYNDKRTDIEETFAKKLINLHNNKPIYGCKIGDKRGGSKNIHSWNLEYNGKISDEEIKLMNLIMLERRKKHWAKKKNIIWMDGMPLTKDEINTFYKNKNLSNMLNNLVNKKYLKLEKCKDLINNKRVYKEDSEIGYNICKGKLSFPISKILDPGDVSPTLTATDSNKLVVIIDNKYIRKLNNSELKKLCGFPNSFKITKDVNPYDLFGNMATPPVIISLLKLIY